MGLGASCLADQVIEFHFMVKIAVDVLPGVDMEGLTADCIFPNEISDLEILN